VLRPAELIERKRDGGELEPDEIAELVLAYARGEVPDYQLAAFCMAVWFRGMTAAETHALTEAMVASGRTLDLSPLGRRVVDKHSTGGVGDKTTIALGPVVAACGVPFAKLSGRGLGHTGGTLDKLESIPGFRVALTEDELVAQVAAVGLAVAGQTDDLVPADRRLYALRDVTATIDSVPLIAASVMAKKLAAGADAIVLDVKVGDGAFMKDERSARRLGETMLELGRRAGRAVACELTAMDEPLGGAVGNALEVEEAIAVLEGGGPPDLVELVVRSAAQLLAFSDLDLDEDDGRRLAEERIRDGAAREAYTRWIRAQGGDAEPDALPRAPVRRPVAAPRAGYVEAVAAGGIGRAALRLGAGRARKEDAVDHAVGIVCLAKGGDRVETGQPLAEVHARDEAAALAAEDEVARSYRLADAPPRSRPLIIDVLR